MSEEIELIIKKIKVAMLKHTQEFYDYDMLVDYELDYNHWKKLLDYITNLQQKVEQLENIRNEAIEYIKKNLTIGSILDGEKTYCLNSYSFDYEDLLNILNKGSDKE